MQAGVGWSLAKNAQAAADEAVEKAIDGLKGEVPGLALLFATVDMDLPGRVRQVGRRLGRIPVFGSSSFTGILTPAGFPANGETAVPSPH